MNPEGGHGFYLKNLIDRDLAYIYLDEYRLDLTKPTTGLWRFRVGEALVDQRASQNWQPLGFFFKKLSTTEKNYFTFYAADDSQAHCYPK